MSKINNDIAKLWAERSRLPAESEVELLRRVLDPSDIKGIKNKYIDEYLKYHLKKYLKPSISDHILEIGCGIGRLTEWLAPCVASILGVDIEDKFIDGCNANPLKSSRSRYVNYHSLEPVYSHINKMFSVWTLMCLGDDDLVSALQKYRQCLPDLQAFVAIEQVKPESADEMWRGAFYCRYRSVESYCELFRRSGFEVRKYHIIPERAKGLFSQLAFNRIVYPLLPGNPSLGKKLQAWDTWLCEIIGYGKKISYYRDMPVDVSFELVVK